MKIDRINLNRRQLLISAAAIGITSTTGLSGCDGSNPTVLPQPIKGAIGEDGHVIPPWSNWSGNQQAAPSHWLIPKDSNELSTMIKQTKQRIRLVGSGHSFSPLVPINENLMSLAYFNGISNIDVNTQQFDVAANTLLVSIGNQLWQQGLALENMPDINTQTFGGAVATSTHGTGANFGSMSDTVQAITLVNGLGEEIECSKDHNSDVFNAARTNLGTLGAVTSMRVQARSKFYLKETTWMVPLNEGLEMAHSLRDSHRHFEFFPLPHADYILVITLDEVPESDLLPPKANNGESLETFKLLSKVIDVAPFLRDFLINRGAASVEREERTGRSYEVYGNVRDIRFNEMEYSIPAEHGVACLREILMTIKKLDIDIIFPLEYRYVKADNIWLSPFYQRDSCSISCHNFYNKDYKKYFEIIEPIFLKYNGRPHWGKIHTLTAKDLQAKYPMFDQFLKVRKAMDPKNIFTNDHINQVLGLT